MDIIKSKFDSETMYRVYTKGRVKYIEVMRNDESMSIKISHLNGYKRLFIPEIYNELCEIQKEHNGRICPICGNRFVAFTKRKYCCDKCARIAQANNTKAVNAEKRKGKKKEKHVSQLTELTREARAKGMSYGQLQAQKYLEQMKGAVI